MRAFTGNDLDSPVIKFFIDFIFYIAAAFIVFVIGLVLSVIFNEFAYLGRAGAVITLIAISMAYKDFYLDLKNMEFDVAVNLLGKEKLFALWSKSFVSKKRVELEKIKPGFNETDTLLFLQKLDELSVGKLNDEGFIKF